MCEWGTDKLVTLNRPREHTGITIVAVDACIADAVQQLNDQEIVTLGCCCGHGRGPANVLIDPASVELALSLGYDVRPAGTDGPSPSIRLRQGE